MVEELKEKSEIIEETVESKQQLRTSCFALSMEFNKEETNNLETVLGEAERIYEWVIKEK